MKEKHYLCLPKIIFHESTFETTNHYRNRNDGA